MHLCCADSLEASGLRSRSLRKPCCYSPRTSMSGLLYSGAGCTLESIFGAPDIQRQLPGPAKAFQVIDKEFRSIMRSVKQKPLALAVCLLLVLCIMSGRQKPHYYSMCCKHTVLSCGKWIRKCLLEQNLWKAVGSEYCSIRKCSQFCVMRP